MCVCIYTNSNENLSQGPQHAWHGMAWLVRVTEICLFYLCTHPSALAHFAARRGLKERLEAGEHVLCAEGYLLALCRRGYVATGVWVPEFLIDHPEVLRSLHYEFIRAGSDVTEAYQVHSNPAQVKFNVHILCLHSSLYPKYQLLPFCCDWQCCSHVKVKL